MPYQDRTGPQGQGPRTGRGMGNCAGQGGTGRGRGLGRGGGRGRERGSGYCAGYDAPGFANPGFGRGMGRGCGRGGGFGWQHRSCWTRQAGQRFPRCAPLTQEENLQALQAEADWLKGQLDAINKRIEELEK